MRELYIISREGKILTAFKEEVTEIREDDFFVFDSVSYARVQGFDLIPWSKLSHKNAVDVSLLLTYVARLNNTHVRLDFETMLMWRTYEDIVKSSPLARHYLFDLEFLISAAVSAAELPVNCDSVYVLLFDKEEEVGYIPALKELRLADTFVPSIHVSSSGRISMRAFGGQKKRRAVVWPHLVPLLKALKKEAGGR